jgi:hypothetical protein
MNEREEKSVARDTRLNAGNRFFFSCEGTQAVFRRPCGKVV